MTERVDLSFGDGAYTPFVPAGGRLSDHASFAAWTCASNYIGLGGAISHAGGPAMYCTAVTTALVVIVSAHWPDQVHRRPSGGATRSATELLDVIERHGEPEGIGVVELQAGSRRVRIEVETLRGAVTRLDAVRHGRGADPDVFPAEHEALDHLMTHPALSAYLGGERQDSEEYAALTADADEVARASSYLELLGEIEVGRRANSVADGTVERDGDLQLCTVCWKHAFCAVSIDSLGVGIGVGTCVVCSYERGEVAAELEARHIRYDDTE